jgi:methyl-accepting chemotaxis protein
VNETAEEVNQITASIQGMREQIKNQTAAAQESGEAIDRIIERGNNLHDHIKAQSDSVSQSSAAIERIFINGISETNKTNIGALVEEVAKFKVNVAQEY